MIDRAKRYLDPMLIIFIVVMVGATWITRHGLQTFYGYLFDDPALSSTITMVIVVGIPLLDLCFFLERSGWRWAYMAGMLLLLVMEIVAQYYQGQANFALAVQSHFPQWQGVDIATIARQPSGRALVVVFLVLPSVVVVGFGAAAANRIRHLREHTPVECSSCSTKDATISSLEKYRDALQDKFTKLREEYLKSLAKVKDLENAPPPPAPVFQISKDTLVEYLRSLEADGLERKEIANTTGFSLNTINGMMGAKQ